MLWGSRAYAAVAVFLARDLIVVLAAFAVFALMRWSPRRERLRNAVALAAVVVCSYALSALLKEIVDRPRPFAADGLAPFIPKDVRDPSFPSGHATVAFALILPLLRVIPSWARVALIAAAAFVALGRVLARVHYVSDVLAGALLAWLVWRLVHWAVKKYTRRLVGDGMT